MSSPLPSALAVSLALVFAGSLLGGCGKRRVLKEDEPEEPVPAPLRVQPAPRLAIAPPPSVPKPVDPTVEAARRWTDARRVRDVVGATLAADQAMRRERLAVEQRERRERQAEERARVQEETARREVQEQEIGMVVTKRARRELVRHAESLKLTIVEEHHLVVRFAKDLRSGTVAYRMALNDTGLLGTNAATLYWKGELTWKRDEDGEIDLSQPEPTTIKPPKSSEPTLAETAVRPE